ncbi:MAG TPA: kelch repeat-containing protein [Solirubrobacteraceae bacterium]
MLVAGGDGTNMPEGELLAADGNGFTAAGHMTQERIFAAGTLLSGGDVLIAGGDPTQNQSTPVPATAEVWSPQNGGTFTATMPMKVSRQVFTLTTLPSGKALAVGGSPDIQSGAGSPTAELYDPSSNSWTLTGSMPSGRLGHTATLLPDCRVLIVGDAPTALTYNYVTGRFSPAGSEGSFQRSYHTATLLASGKVLIAGGERFGGVALDSASVWDPSTGKFTPTANHMSTAHVQGFSARLPDGRVLVGGGFSEPAAHPPTETNKVDIYDPATNKWTTVSPLPAMSEAISPEAETLQDGNVVVTGIGALGTSTDVYAPSFPGRAVSPPAQNCADLTNPFKVESVKAGSNHAIKVTVQVPESGKLAAIATAQTWKTSSPKKWFGYGSATLSPGQAGTYTMTVSPSSHARVLLRSRHTLRVKITTAYKPALGPSASKTVTVGVRPG